MLPLGQGFCFVLSGELDLLPSHIRKRIGCKSWQMVGFSLDETIKYFADRDLEPGGRGPISGLWERYSRTLS